MQRVPVRARFPLLLLLGVVLLGSLGLSGSSVGMYIDRGVDNGLLAGRARPIRTDEWSVRTPLLVRQEQLGLADESVVGVGRHDMGVLLEVPTDGWDVVVRPQLAVYRVFGTERAFAFEWWLRLALGAFGIYCLLVALRVRVLIASLTAVIVMASPVVQWWSTNGVGPSIGFGCLTAAAAIAAVHAGSTSARLGWAAVSGWMAACLFAALYPPWTVPMGLIAAAAVVGEVIRVWPPREQRRDWLRTLGLLALTAGGVAGVLIIGFVVTHSDALRAVQDSIYPGKRRNGGGDGALRLLLDSPFDILNSRHDNVLVNVNGTNQTEASSGLFLLVPVALAVLVDWRRVKTRARDYAPLLALLAVGAGLLAWFLLPIPETLGKIVLLDRVQPTRLLLPFAVLSGLVLAIAVDRRARDGECVSWTACAVAAGVFLAGSLWAGFELRLNLEEPDRALVVLLALAFGAAVLLALRYATAGFVALAVLAVITAVPINPLQHGLQELTDSPAARLGRRLHEQPGAVLAVANGPAELQVRGGLTASGAPVVSGVDLYPNARAWRRVDRDGDQRRVWDRYANARFFLGRSGSEPKLHLVAADAIEVTVDPCGPEMRTLGVRFVVSFEPLARACLRETQSVPASGGRLRAYEIRR